MNLGYGKGIILLVAAVLLAGCAHKASTGAFTQVNRIDDKLKKGKSTKMDAHRVLGAPKGTGKAVLPTDPKPREIWFYDDIELTDYKGEEPGVIRVSVRQQILLLFFEREVFDGYMWFTNAGTADIR